MGIIKVNFGNEKRVNNKNKNKNKRHERLNRESSFEPSQKTWPAPHMQKPQRSVRRRSPKGYGKTPSDVIAESLDRPFSAGLRAHPDLAAQTIAAFLSEFLAVGIKAQQHQRSLDLKGRERQLRRHTIQEPKFEPNMPGQQVEKDQEVFWEVWTSQQERLERLSLRLMSGNQADAEDAIGTAMMNGCKAFSLQNVSNINGWLSRLVHNACMDIHRQRVRHATPMANEDLEIEMQYCDGDTFKDRSPEEFLIGKEEAGTLIDGLHTLPQNLLEPLLMRCLGGNDYNDIAAKLGISNAAARKRIQLARQQLRKMF